MAGKSVRFKNFKDRKKQFKRSTDSAQKGSEKKDRDDTDDEAEKKEGKATPKLRFNRADVLEYCKDLERTLRAPQPIEGLGVHPAAAEDAGVQRAFDDVEAARQEAEVVSGWRRIEPAIVPENIEPTGHQHR